METSAVEEVPASSSAPLSSWGSQADVHNSECVSASEGLRDGSIVSTPQLFSISGDTAGSEKITPPGSDDVVDHEASGPAHSSVNDVNGTGTSSSSKSKSATGALDHGASDAMQPCCDSINGNDTTSRDSVSVTGAEKDPTDISSINKNIDNSVNDSSDNNVSVIVVHSGFVPPSGVSNIIYATEDVAGNVGRDVGAGHVVSGKAVVVKKTVPKWRDA